MLPIMFVATESIVPPRIPRTKGTALPKLMTRFSPNFVRSRKQKLFD